MGVSIGCGLLIESVQVTACGVVVVGGGSIASLTASDKLTG